MHKASGAIIAFLSITKEINIDIATIGNIKRCKDSRMAERRKKGRDIGC